MLENYPLKLEYVIIIFLLIIAIVVLFYKSIEPEPSNIPIKPIKSILKKQPVYVPEDIPKNNVKFYDVRMSQISNDIDVIKNQQPTDELLSLYQPAREVIPTDNIHCNSQTGKLQPKPLRFNI
jgi:hypothetical protein|tara:strand:- start:12 stop:380 length:369 start_codon:yes stop_codon:yes gene_type:complete